jgi:hypothetical protein
MRKRDANEKEGNLCTPDLEIKRPLIESKVAGLPEYITCRALFSLMLVPASPTHISALRPEGQLIAAPPDSLL